jgi:hypothetical protein
MESTAARRRIPSSGQVAVLGMLALAVLAAGFAWSWNFNRGRKALEFYGPEAATLIRTAPKVEIVVTQSGNAIDISQAPGLINARSSLLSDASYRWDLKAEEPPPDAPAVRFSNHNKSVIVRFAFPAHGMWTSSTNRVVMLAPKTANGWKTYLERYVKLPDE